MVEDALKPVLIHGSVGVLQRLEVRLQQTGKARG